jgi:hypothetical protein
MNFNELELHYPQIATSFKLSHALKVLNLSTFRLEDNKRDLQGNTVETIQIKNMAWSKTYIITHNDGIKGL